MTSFRLHTYGLLVSALSLPALASNDPAALKEGTPKVEEPGNDAELNFDKGLLTVLAETNIKVTFGGRLHFDVGFMQADDDLKTPAAGEPALAFADGTEFRAARFFAKGTIYDVVDFKVDYDFVGGDADFKDVYMETDLDFASLRVGHFKEPFGLEQNTSSNFTSFNERSLTEALVPGRNSGVMLHEVLECEKPTTVAVGFFRNTNDFGDDQTTDSGEYNLTARGTMAPMFSKEEGKVLHFGLAGSLASDVSGTNRFSTRPENHLAPAIADTRAMGVTNFGSNGYALVGAEAAWTDGPISAQAELVIADVEGAGATNDATFSAYYAMVSYFITGEHRPYKDGVFQRVKPKGNYGQGGKGAVELLARYSSLDLTSSGIRGGELDDYTLGVNWYLNPNVRVMCNYIHSDLSNSGLTSNAHGTLDALLLRFQLDF